MSVWYTDGSYGYHVVAECFFKNIEVQCITGVRHWTYCWGSLWTTQWTSSPFNPKQNASLERQGLDPGSLANLWLKIFKSFISSCHVISHGRRRPGSSKCSSLGGSCVSLPGSPGSSDTETEEDSVQTVRSVTLSIKRFERTESLLSLIILRCSVNDDSSQLAKFALTYWAPFSF